MLTINKCFTPFSGSVSKSGWCHAGPCIGVPAGVRAWTCSLSWTYSKQELDLGHVFFDVTYARIKRWKEGPKATLLTAAGAGTFHGLTYRCPIYPRATGAGHFGLRHLCESYRTPTGSLTHLPTYKGTLPYPSSALAPVFRCPMVLTSLEPIR